MSLTIKQIPGQMPEVWDRPIIFFANLLSLFYGNELETDVLKAEVGALETYGSRLIPLLNLIFTGGENCLVLEKEPQDVLLEYFRKELQLTLPKIIVLPHHVYRSVNQEPSQWSEQMAQFIEFLKAQPTSWIDGYVTDSCLVELAKFSKKKTISTFKGSHRGNNKLNLYEYLSSKGMPQFDTIIVKSFDNLNKALQQLKQMGYAKAVVKAQIGASGIGMVKVNLLSINGVLSTEIVPEYLFYEGPCLVQGWLDESVANITYVGSPSVQMFIKNDVISLHDITDQILNVESVHEGNVAPPHYCDDDKLLKKNLFDQAQVAAKWLHRQGYRGTSSADFHVVERRGKTEVRICELNARVTGATYPAILARHFLPKGAWLLRNIRFSPGIKSDHLLRTLRETDILYTPGKREGILPFNFNPDSRGLIVKGQFLFMAKHRDQAWSLLKKITEIESIKGNYDRD